MTQRCQEELKICCLKSLKVKTKLYKFADSSIITINVPLFNKMRDIHFFMRDYYF